MSFELGNREGILFFRFKNVKKERENELLPDFPTNNACLFYTQFCPGGGRGAHPGFRLSAAAGAAI